MNTLDTDAGQETTGTRRTEGGSITTPSDPEVYVTRSAVRAAVKHGAAPHPEASAPRGITADSKAYAALPPTDIDKKAAMTQKIAHYRAALANLGAKVGQECSYLGKPARILYPEVGEELIKDGFNICPDQIIVNVALGNSNKRTSVAVYPSSLIF